MADRRPILTMTGISKSFPGVTALARRRLPALPRRGARPDGRERRRQVHPHQGADRRLRHRRGRDHARRRAGRVHRPAAGAARRRQHRLPGGQPLRQPLGGGEHLHRPRAAPLRRGSAGARCAAGPPSCWPASTSTSTSARRSSSYSLAIQQMVAIARAIDIEAKVLILDEPTSSLDAGEVAQLFRVMRQLRDEGIAILFVTHFLDQVYEIADRITVLRNGRLVGEYLTTELPQLDLVEQDDRQGARRPRRARASTRPAGTWPRMARAPRRCCAPTSSAGRARSSRSASPSTTARSSAWPACSAPAAPRWPGCSSAPTGPTSGTVTVDGTPVALRSPRPAIAQDDRVLLGEPPDRGPRRRADGPGEHHPGHAGRPRLGRGPSPRRRQDELVAQVHQGAQHPPGRTRSCRYATSPAATSRRCCWPAG